MLQYNEQENVLYAYKNKCAIPKVEEMLDTSVTVVEDLSDYYNNKIIEDFIAYVKPELEELFQNNSSCPNITIKEVRPHLVRHDINDIDDDRYKPYEKLDAYTISGHRKNHTRILEDRSLHIEVKFNVPGLDDSRAEWITVMKVPYFDPISGVMTINGVDYVFNYMLEQSDGISYVANLDTANKPNITIKTSKNPIILEPAAKGINITIKDTFTGKGGNASRSLVSVIGGTLEAEGFNPREVWDEFKDVDIVNIYKTEEALGLDLYYHGGSSGRLQADDYVGRVSQTSLDALLPGDSKPARTSFSGGMISKLLGEDFLPNGSINKMYDTTLVRDALNEVLSLDAGIGCQLFKDAVDDNGNVIRPANTVLAKNDILALQKAGIYKIYVRSIPTIIGARVDQDIFLPYISIGTLVSDAIQEVFPEEDGMYTTQLHRIEDVPLDKKHAFAIPAGTVITDEIMSLLVNSGIDEITAKLGTSNTPKKIYFYDEIISNRQFRGKWIGKTGEDADKWFYKNSHNEYVPQEGHYGYRAYDFVALMSCATKVFADRPYVNIPNIDVDFRKTLATPSIQFARAMQFAARDAISSRSARHIGVTLTDKAAKAANEFYVRDSELSNKFYRYTVAFNDYLIKTAKCLRRLSQDAYINPVAYISEVTKANVFTKGKHSVTDSQRTIAIGSYGKIDAFEIPQSGKMGVVNNLTVGAHFDKTGKLQTPYHKVNIRNGKAYIDLENITYMDVIEEEKVVIADICSIHVSDDGEVAESIEDYVLCRVPGVGVNERQLFERYPIKEVNYVTHDAVQTLSWSSAVIPFICNNDAARAVFAIAQIKQCKGHRNAETPAVMTTAYKMLPMMNDVFGLVCQEDGYVVQSGVDRKTDEHICTIEYPPKGVMTRFTGNHDSNHGYHTRKKSLYLTGTNSYTEFKYNADAHQGDINVQDYYDKTPIKRGTAAVGSNFIADDGFLKLGVDLLVAYRPYYNYEDSTCLSKSAARKVCTYRVNKEILYMHPSTKVYSINNLAELMNADIIGPDEVVNTVEVGYYDVVGENSHSHRLQSAYGKFLKQVPHVNDNGFYDGVELWLLSEDYVDIGDKFSNRHGNKATVSKIFKDAEMPRLRNGMAIEMELNPLGVGSRMNIGQILEIHLGLVCHVLGIRLCADAYNGINEDEVKMLLSLTVDLADSTGDPSTVLAQYDIPENLKNICKRNIDKIRVYANCFTKRGTTKLIIPKDDGKFTETECLVGWVHEFKLIQESATKVHARANEITYEPYASLSDAPTKGASNAGGQRLGNMEVSALAAYNANGLMHEIMNERSDNAIARNNFNVYTYLNKLLGDSLIEEGKGQRRSVTQLLYTMLALGIFTESTNGEIIPLSKNNHFDLARPKPQSLRDASRKYQRKVEEYKKDIKTEASEVATDLISGIDVGDTDDVADTPIQVSEESTPVPAQSSRKFTSFAADAMYKMQGGKVED